MSVVSMVATCVYCCAFLRDRFVEGFVRNHLGRKNGGAVHGDGGIDFDDELHNSFDDGK